MEASPVPLMDVELDQHAVRQRFAAALRAGNPLWLWPETTPEKWQAALFEIDLAARSILSGDPDGASLMGDPGDIGIAAFTSGMGPLLGYWANANLLKAEPAVLQVLELHLSHNRDRMDDLAKVAAAAVEAFGEAGIEVTVLKGMHTAYDYFPVPGTRPASDIDLWIKPSDARAANATLSQLGYLLNATSFGEQNWKLPDTPAEPRSLSLVHRDGPWSIDLHTTVDCRYSTGAPMIQMDRALRAGERRTWALSPAATVLTGPALVLHLAFHASLGLTSLSMLRLTELVFVIRQLQEADGFSWEEFGELAALTGNPGCTYPALALVNVLAPGTVPDDVVRELQGAAPATVRRVIAPLSPATCQRVTRCSFEERFMWTATLGGWTREITDWLFPAIDPSTLCKIYKMRFWRLVNGTVSRQNPGTAR